jgi:hypothetical protein
MDPRPRSQSEWGSQSIEIRLFYLIVSLCCMLVAKVEHKDCGHMRSGRVEMAVDKDDMAVCSQLCGVEAEVQRARVEAWGCCLLGTFAALGSLLATAHVSVGEKLVARP